MNALSTKKVQGIKEIRQIYNFKSEYSIFAELTSKNPVLLTEFIPFYSKEFNLSNSDIERAYFSLPGFKRYFDGIINLIEESTGEQGIEGIIIMDGVNPSKLFEEKFKNEIENLYSESYKGRFAYS
ncbi:hypothetical protein [Paenibacillus antarcticus]|uniref:Uncharacterized protein n=1 Tax=Paenibacillus antarcticus TaxID=253703 RepID=A0A162LXB3_9BACL|nr:hypothetical protein [Paenibacillus antarcticus]OAB41207.1 hypothetical protein PBAT_21885 [Paenibacillus antarcticus]